jgi:predicted permease
MNHAFFSILEQMGVFLLLIGAGAAGALLKVLNRNTLTALSSFAMNFSLPCLVFSSAAGSMTKEQLLSSWPLIPVSLFVSGLMFAFGALSARLCRLSGSRKRIHICQSAFSNWGMIGIPLISALFGTSGMLPLTLFLICDQLLLWTLGVRLTYPVESAPAGFSLKKLLNPVLLSAILGICFALFGLRLPEPFAGTVQGLGATTKHLSLVFVGGTLALSAKESPVKSFSPFCVVLFKMLLCPATVYCALRLTGLFDYLTAVVFAVIAGLPSMCTIPMIAKANGSDDAYASTVALITTICGAVTLPLLLQVLDMLPF